MVDFFLSRISSPLQEICEITYIWMYVFLLEYTCISITTDMRPLSSSLTAVGLRGLE